jgi:hypothetical protein
MATVLEPLDYRFLAVLGGVGAGALAVFAAILTFLHYELYSWEACSYDIWNAVIVAAGVGAVIGLAIGAAACLLYATDSEGSAVIKLALPAGILLTVVGLALLSTNPTPDDDTVKPGTQNCYGTLG